MKLALAYRLLLKRTTARHRPFLRTLQGQDLLEYAAYLLEKERQDEHLRFFGICQPVDESQKVRNVARYVGLEMPVITVD